MNKRKPGIGVFWGVLTSPGRTFEQLAENPTFIWPALITVVINLLVTLALLPKLRAYTLWLLEHTPTGVSPEQLEATKSLAANWAVIAGIISALVMPWFIWLVITLLLKLYGLVSTRGTSFGVLFAVAVYGYLPSLIGSVLSNLIALGVPAENLARVSISLAAFMPATKGFLYFFLAQCSPFLWWSLGLWGFGAAIVMKKKPAGAIITLFSCWLVYAVLIALYAAAKTPAGLG